MKIRRGFSRTRHSETKGTGWVIFGWPSAANNCLVIYGGNLKLFIFMPSRIDKLTKTQEAAMPDYAQKWIDIGLKTGDADWDTFDKNMPICYEKAGLKYPVRVVRVSSPLVGALAAAVAEGIWKKKRGAVRGAVGDAVGGAFGGGFGAFGGAFGGVHPYVQKINPVIKRS